MSQATVPNIYIWGRELKLKQDKPIILSYVELNSTPALIICYLLYWTSSARESHQSAYEGDKIMKTTKNQQKIAFIK